MAEDRKYRSRISPESFIAQCNSVHNCTYDYSLIGKELLLSKKIPIICPHHGIFEQMAHSHLDGARCPKCVDVSYRGSGNPTFKKMEKGVFSLPVTGIRDIKVIPKPNSGKSSTQVEIVCENHGRLVVSLYRLRRHLTCPICKHEEAYPNSRMKSNLRSYHKAVWYYTNWHWDNHQKFINHYGYNRSTFGYHLDHIYSISQGFSDCIPPWIIGHWTNLWLTPASLNSSKGKRCGKSRNQLFLDFDWARRKFNQKEPVPYRPVFNKRSI
jgi:hypothetical protein